MVERLKRWLTMPFIDFLLMILIGHKTQNNQITLCNRVGWEPQPSGNAWKHWINKISSSKIIYGNTNLVIICLRLLISLRFRARYRVSGKRWKWDTKNNFHHAGLSSRRFVVSKISKCSRYRNWFLLLTGCMKIKWFASLIKINLLH